MRIKRWCEALVWLMLGRDSGTATTRHTPWRKENHVPTDGDLQRAKNILGDQSIVRALGGRRLERERIAQDHLQDHLLKKYDR
jgi:hypothetical protein